MSNSPKLSSRPCRAWTAMPLLARCLGNVMFESCDDQGFIDLNGLAPADAVAAAVYAHPSDMEELRLGLATLVAHGFARITESAVELVDFKAAYEGGWPRSDAASVPPDRES